MAFVRFAPTWRRGRGMADAPIVRFSVHHSGKGTFQLNTRARKDLGVTFPVDLDVWVDTESQLVALSAADGRGTKTIRMQTIGTSSATMLMREMSIAPGHYPARMDGDRLIIDVNESARLDDKAR